MVVRPNAKMKRRTDFMIIIMIRTVGLAMAELKIRWILFVAA